jgi:hypothetical protein
MSLLSDRAEKAYGKKFVDESTAVAGRLGISAEWLLAAMAWETGWPPGFKSNGPPWPENPSDHGFGLIGFTRKRGTPPRSFPDSTRGRWSNLRLWKATIGPG